MNTRGMDEGKARRRRVAWLSPPALSLAVPPAFPPLRAPFSRWPDNDDARSGWRDVLLGVWRVGVWRSGRLPPRRVGRHVRAETWCGDSSMPASLLLLLWLLLWLFCTAATRRVEAMGCAENRWGVWVVKGRGGCTLVGEMGCGRMSWGVFTSSTRWDDGGSASPSSCPRFTTLRLYPASGDPTGTKWHNQVSQNPPRWNGPSSIVPAAAPKSCHSSSQAMQLQHDLECWETTQVLKTITACASQRTAG